MVLNYISFDVEHWYDSEFVLDKNQKKDLVLEGLTKVLGILEDNNVKATFFITGKVAEQYPDCVREIFSQGHEIASHGYSHTMLDKLSSKEALVEIKRSKDVLKKITGINPKGFRAPSWSINTSNLEVYNLLQKKGYKYSSSLFPLNIGLYGNSKFPMHKFKPLRGKNFIEIPIRHYTLGKIRLPFSGGFYFRLIPLFLLKYFFREINKAKKKVILYLHPWEFCEDIPRTRTTFIGRFTTYYATKRNANKLDKILKRFKFVPLGDALKDD
jgi:polysaccharide deacetylase family protein (PEP-CTERM system associated)